MSAINCEYMYEPRAIELYISDAHIRPDLTVNYDDDLLRRRGCARQPSKPVHVAAAGSSCWFVDDDDLFRTTTASTALVLSSGRFGETPHVDSSAIRSAVRSVALARR